MQHHLNPNVASFLIRLSTPSHSMTHPLPPFFLFGTCTYSWDTWLVGVVQRNQPVYICSCGVHFYISFLRSLFKALFFCLHRSQSVSKCLFLQSARPASNPSPHLRPSGLDQSCCLHRLAAKADFLLSSVSRHFNNKLRFSLFMVTLVSFFPSLVDSLSL